MKPLSCVIMLRLLALNMFIFVIVCIVACVYIYVCGLRIITCNDMICI